MVVGTHIDKKCDKCKEIDETLCLMEQYISITSDISDIALMLSILNDNVVDKTLNKCKEHTNNSK